MKKKLLILFLFFPFLVQAQNFDEKLDGIIKEFSNSLANQIFLKRISMEKAVNDKETVYIYINYLCNNHGQQTKFSGKIGSKLSNYLQLYLNKVIIKRFYFKLTSPYDIKIPKTKVINDVITKDFTLTGHYKISGSKIIFSGFKLKALNSNVEMNFDDIKISIDSDIKNKISKLNNEQLEDNSLKSFIEFSKDNIFVKDIYITKWNDVQNAYEAEVSTEIDGIGNVCQNKYNIDYNLHLEVLQNSYIYAFFYDPEEDFIWAIENTNKQFTPRKYPGFFEDNMNFYPNNSQNQQYCYIKLIATDKIINIDKFYIRKIIDGYEAVIIDKIQAKQLLELIKNRTNIQTKNIILTFKN